MHSHFSQKDCPFRVDFASLNSELLIPFVRVQRTDRIAVFDRRVEKLYQDRIRSRSRMFLLYGFCEAFLAEIYSDSNCFCYAKIRGWCYAACNGGNDIFSRIIVPVDVSVDKSLAERRVV